MSRSTLPMALTGLLATAVLTAGCSGAPTNPPPAPPTVGASASATPGAKPAISTPVIIIERSGGIAGVQQLLRVDNNGSWTWLDDNSGASARGKLTGDQQTQLNTLVTDPQLFAELDVTSGACADGFKYTVTVDAVQKSFVDCGGANRPTVSAALALLAEATAL